MKDVVTITSEEFDQKVNSAVIKCLRHSKEKTIDALHLSVLLATLRDMVFSDSKKDDESTSKKEEVLSTKESTEWIHEFADGMKYKVVVCNDIPDELKKKIDNMMDRLFVDEDEDDEDDG